MLWLSYNMLKRKYLNYSLGITCSNQEWENSSDLSKVLTGLTRHFQTRERLNALNRVLSPRKSTNYWIFQFVDTHQPSEPKQTVF